MANTTFLTGNLTRDPDYSPGTDTTKARARFTVAADRMGEGTDFVPVTVFGATADAVSRYLGKGDQVAVTGSLSSSSYERDGKTIYSLDVVANRVDFLTRREGPSIPAPSLAATHETPAAQGPTIA